MTNRGFFAIGILAGKSPLNIGTLWRTAHNFGAQYIFTIGHRYPHQPTDTTKAWKHIPLLEFDTFAQFQYSVPRETELVAIEQDSRSRDLTTFTHPERACYILGAEDHGIAPEVLKQCMRVVSIDTPMCINVAVAGSIIMYDRVAKLKERNVLLRAARTAS